MIKIKEKIIQEYNKIPSMYYFYATTFFGFLTSFLFLYEQTHPNFSYIIPLSTFIIQLISTCFFIFKKDKKEYKNDFYSNSKIINEDLKSIKTKFFEKL